MTFWYNNFGPPFLGSFLGGFLGSSIPPRGPGFYPPWYYQQYPQYPPYPYYPPFRRRRYW